MERVGRSRVGGRFVHVGWQLWGSVTSRLQSHAFPLRHQEGAARLHWATGGFAGLETQHKKGGQDTSGNILTLYIVANSRTETRLGCSRLPQKR